MSKRVRVPPPPIYFTYHDLSEVLARETGFLLSYVAQMAHMALNDALEPLDIDARQLGVLTLIAETEHRSQIAISRNMGLDRTHVVRLVDALEELGYVRRERDADDRRYYQLVLTPEGEAALDQARRLTRESQGDVFRCLDDTERKTLTRLLREVAEQRFSRAQGERARKG